MRKLNSSESEKLRYLTSKRTAVALIEPTTTGLRKSIIDATKPVRDLLYSSNIHDYTKQLLGPDNKVVLNCYIFENNSFTNTTISLYRPVTKKGDPRLWISGLNRICRPNNIIALAIFNNTVYAFNLTKEAIIKTQLESLFIKIENNENEVAFELLTKLKVIHNKGFIACSYTGDTAIGHLLEEQLGIIINSSKEPDYKGIELKSYRSERSNRKSLFAQVADWEISKFKSSKQILDTFGYHRDKVFRLYCTVTANAFNSQGLRLGLRNDGEILAEYSEDASIKDFACWKIEKLQQRLVTKHNETFWVEAECETRDDIQYFKFTKVEHTKSPIVEHLPILLDNGRITLDHAIKLKGASVVEKGPFFKLARNGLAELFPPSDIYDLSL
jgi:hypothetical protein